MLELAPDEMAVPRGVTLEQCHLPAYIPPKARHKPDIPLLRENVLVTGQEVLEDCGGLSLTPAMERGPPCLCHARRPR